MAIEVNITSIGAGFNRSVIDNNFTNIKNALENALSRNGQLPNSIQTDLDMDSNDLLNVGDINTQRLFVDGQEFVGSDATAVGDRGWSPSFAIVNDSARRVLQLTGYVGGEGTVPTINVGKYVGATQMETLIANGVDIRGPQGASGSGSGDMLASQNLNDVLSKPTAFANIKQAATTSATGVVELATDVEAAAGVDTTRAVTPSGLTAFAAANPSGAEILLLEGSHSGSANLDLVLSTYTNYKHIKVILTNIRASAGSPSLSLRYSSNGGSSFNSGGADYLFSRTFSYSTDGSGTDSGQGSSILLEEGIPTASTQGADLSLTFYDWQNATSYMKCMGEMVKSSPPSSGSSVGSISLIRCGGYRVASQLNNAVRFLLSSGTMTCSYTIYGIK